MDILHNKMFWLDKVGNVREMDKFGRGINISLVTTQKTGSILPTSVVAFQEMKYPLNGRSMFMFMIPSPDYMLIDIC